MFPFLFYVFHDYIDKLSINKLVHGFVIHLIGWRLFEATYNCCLPVHQCNSMQLPFQVKKKKLCGSFCNSLYLLSVYDECFLKTFDPTFSYISHHYLYVPLEIFFIILFNFMKGEVAAHMGQSVSDCNLDWSYVGVPVLIHFVFGARWPCFNPCLFQLLLQLSSNQWSDNTYNTSNTCHQSN